MAGGTAWPRGGDEEAGRLAEAEGRAASAEARVALLEERLKQVGGAAREQQDALHGLRQARLAAECAEGGALPQGTPPGGGGEAAYQALVEAERRALVLAQAVEAAASGLEGGGGGGVAPPAERGPRSEGARLTAAEAQAEKADRCGGTTGSRQQHSPPASGAADSAAALRAPEDGPLRGGLPGDLTVAETRERGSGAPSSGPPARPMAESSVRLLAHDLEVAAAEGMAQETEISRFRAETVDMRKQVSRGGTDDGDARVEGVAAQLQRKQEAAQFDGGDAKENESEMAQFAMLEGWCFERDWRVTEARAAASHSAQAQAFSDLQACLRGAEGTHEGGKGDHDTLRDHLAEEIATERASATDHAVRQQARALPRSAAPEAVFNESREEAERQVAAWQAESRDLPLRRSDEPGDGAGGRGGPQDSKLRALQQRLDTEQHAPGSRAEKELAVARQTLEKSYSE